MAREASKQVDKGWQKKAGLDLRLDKPRVFKEDLARAREEGRVVPTSTSAQIHAHAIRKARRLQPLSEEEIAWRESVKKILFKKVDKLLGSGRKAARGSRGRLKVEGLAYCFLQLGGTLEDFEADRIVDCAIRLHKKPGGHPLQVEGSDHVHFLKST